MQGLGVPLEDTGKLTRLWAHETLRVFHDRLVSDGDRSWFQNLLKASASLSSSTTALTYPAPLARLSGGNFSMPH